ncbi:MAG: hypothetical protein GYA21_09500 [Myxococcales bacterium]|nr:hypothetical protein [Myxococcales bacterium]
MAIVDANRFPTVARYLEVHRGRLDRYPQCQGKGGLLRDVVEEQLLAEVMDVLPPEVAELLKNPPPVNVWTSEMLMEVVFQAVGDLHFRTAAEAEEWVYTHDLARFQGKLYRLLMVVMSPIAVLRTVGKRWEAFHRGTTLDVQAEKNRALGFLRFPEWLYLPESKINMCGSFRAALAAGGAKQTAVRLIEVTSTQHVYEAIWN